MAQNHGSVRMGPISIFALVIILCVAVMSVLAVTTAQAARASSDRQASFTDDTYLNEIAGQEFLASLDATLAPVRSAGSGQSAAVSAVESALPQLLAQVQQARAGVTAEGSLEGTTVRATFMTISGRELDVAISITSNATYQVVRWSTTTQWTDEGSSEALWSGAATR